MYSAIAVCKNRSWIQYWKWLCFSMQKKMIKINKQSYATTQTTQVVLISCSLCLRVCIYVMLMWWKGIVVIYAISISLLQLCCFCAVVVVVGFFFVFWFFLQISQSNKLSNHLNISTSPAWLFIVDKSCKVFSDFLYKYKEGGK